MGIDPFILQKPQFAKRLTAEARKKEGILTSEEAIAKQEARSEKELQEQIVNLLHLRGVKRVIRSRMDKKTTNANGTPDLLFVYRGKPYAFEVKFGRSIISTEQSKALSEFERDGWDAWIVKSLDKVKSILDATDRRDDGDGELK